MLTTILLVIIGIAAFLVCLRFGLIGLFFDILLAILSSGGDSKSTKSGGFGKGSSGGGGSSDSF